MNDLSKSRPVTRLGLVSYLNDELRGFQHSQSRRCGCRVVNLSPQASASGSSWRAEFLGNKCDPGCLSLVQGIISELRSDFDLSV